MSDENENENEGMFSKDWFMPLFSFTKAEPDEDKDENGKRKDLVSRLRNRQRKVAKAISKQERELSRITQLIELLSGDSELAKQIMDQMEHLDLLK